MALSKISLEDYLRKHRGEKTTTNVAKSFEEYAAGRANDPSASYAKAVRAALTGADASGAYGALGESLGRGGLAGGGYAAHLERLGRLNADTAIAEAEESRAAAYRDISEGYESYLLAYSTKHNTIKNQLYNSLLKSNVANMEYAFSVGLEMGLTAEEAAGVSTAVYKVMRERMYKDLIAAVAFGKISPNSAKKQAMQSDLLAEDVEFILDEVDRWADINEADRDYLYEELKKNYPELYK